MSLLSDKSNIPTALDLYTVMETAAILSVSQQSVFAWIKAGTLKAIRIGPGQRLIRIRRVDLEAFIAQHPPATPDTRLK